MTLRLAHLADVHLGHRRFTRNENGMNVRERDVATAFQRAMTEIRAARPDVLAIAGDLFDRVNPPNASLILAFLQVRDALAELPDLHVVIACGDHEIPRTSETQCALDLLAALPRVHVARQRPERFEVPGGVVWAVPAVATGVQHHQLPSPEGVLVLHGEIAGTIPAGDRPALCFQADQLNGWRFACLGHFHTHTVVRENAAYSGSLEYVSTDSWAEARSGIPKGWMLVDVPDAGAPSIKFHPGPTRRFLDLALFDAAGMSAAELDRRIAQVVDEANIADAVVRLVVTGVTRDLRAGIDHQAIRGYKSRALHFQLELRRAEPGTNAVLRRREMKRLDDVVMAFLGERELPPDVDRQEFVRIGMAAFTEDPYTGERVA